jgi:hypothetical protein
LMTGIKAIQEVLQSQGKCGCASLEECGRGLLRKHFGKITPRSLQADTRRAESIRGRYSS